MFCNSHSFHAPLCIVISMLIISIPIMSKNELAERNNEFFSSPLGHPNSCIIMIIKSSNCESSS